MSTRLTSGEAPAGPRASGRAFGAFLRYAALRAVLGVGVLWSAATLGFLTLRLVPGDTAYAIVGGPEASPSPEVLAQVRLEHGLDRPWYEQYGAYLVRLLQGDLGESYRLRRPVADAIGEQLGATVTLGLTAAALAVTIAVVAALVTAKRGRWVRGTSSAAELFLIAAPGFWIGIVLLTIFSFGLGWLPSIGSEGWPSLVLPAVTIAIGSAAVLTQVLREALEQALDEPFITSARARGLGETGVRLGHALRHALLPLATMSGFVVGGLLGGAVIAESLFGRQGVGRMLLTAVNSKDMPMVLGLVLLSALAYVVVNFVVDLAYPLIDPRLRGAT
ncbi:binding-protein-dependent transport systems inner membrane component [Beutenbergia cavernae DSM 12333]|uniref:Binding-protein-dependent transport systems inner membrane component n=1 Tax=Beutenbergia cavernae (strain ATCC BAA-8 / DSM 12333 / CCUG 43141 / JCM 11478 / NBRC 16432 / NCIMB 13614 / HKI 0122) TaxID=471853 RepID=C5C4S4_BEUC1|nr:ABC transporter permease [Beutenbergia cavernae]ACQ80052.1 binding-protein-dependent transport systems inner membrane component [Beutenbergia cavernae DSM 12333]